MRTDAGLEVLKLSHDVHASGPVFDPTTVFVDPLTRDDGTGVWGPERYEANVYPSDDYARGTLYDVLMTSHDLSSLSPELERKGTGWPARYYLSASRTTLLRPFGWDRSATVMEIGSGCGTITRFLGETFDRVIAVEGERHRAEVGAARSRDQDNVAVVCAPFADLKLQQPVDIIFCIGVLEYSPLYSDAEDPILDTLESVRARLGDAGTVVIAIENKLGLKYFAGAAEDHTAVRYDGIEGYRRSGGRGPRTMGKRELTDRLRQAGFERVDFYYPFPDYKFPLAIASDDAVENAGPPLAEFVGRGDAGDYLAGPTKLHFEQRLVWQQLAENGLVGELANSFLIIASTTPDLAHVEVPWDMASYNLAPRRPEFWTETTVRDLAGPAPTVSRRRLRPAPVTGPVQIRDSYSEPWHFGQTVGYHAAQCALGRDATVNDIAQVLRPWVDHLEAHADAEGNLPGSFLDVIPQNLVLIGDEILPIDSELAYEGLLPLELVISRGLAVFFAKTRDLVGVSNALRGRPLGALMIATARALGLPYGPRQLKEYADFEARVDAAVHGTDATGRRVLAALVAPPQVKRLRAAAFTARRAAGKARRAFRGQH